MGSSALGSKGATGGGMGRPLWFGEIIQEGKFLPILPLVTVADPGNSSDPPGGVCVRFIPDMGLPRAGGPEKPLAQQGLCRIQSLQTWLKQKLHSSVMVDSLHLSQTLLSGGGSCMGWDVGLPVKGALVKSKTSLVGCVAPRLFIQAIAFPPEGLDCMMMPRCSR